MSAAEILFYAGTIAALPVFLWLAFSRKADGDWRIASVLLIAFTAYSAVTIAVEGPLTFLPNHTQDLWGVQVWYDLIIALVVSLFLLAPRARAAGVNPLPWILLTGVSGSIAMLVLLARVLHAEAKQPR